MLLKALPLALPLRIVRGNLYTYQWAAMLSLLYLMEGRCAPCRTRRRCRC